MYAVRPQVVFLEVFQQLLIIDHTFLLLSLVPQFELTLLYAYEDLTIVGLGFLLLWNIFSLVA